MERRFRRGYPAARLFLRALGCPAEAIDRVVCGAYLQAHTRELAVTAVLLQRGAALSAEGRAPSRSRPSPTVHTPEPQAAAWILSFAGSLEPRARLVFFADACLGAEPPAVAAALEIAPAAISTALELLRREFRTFLEDPGCADRADRTSSANRADRANRAASENLLAAAIAAERLPRAAEDALWARLQRRLADAATEPPTRPPSPTSDRLGYLVSALTLPVALYLLLTPPPAQPRAPGLLATTHDRAAAIVAAQAARAQAAASARAEEARAAAEAAEAAEAEAKAEAEATAAAEAEAAARPRSRRRSTRGDRRQGALAAREAVARDRDPGKVIVELEMLKAAKNKLATSPRQALALAEQHAREHPHSQLRESRDDLRIAALCALGEAAKARSLAASIRAVHPASAVDDALRRHCPGAP